MAKSVVVVGAMFAMTSAWAQDMTAPDAPPAQTTTPPPATPTTPAPSTPPSSVPATSSPGTPIVFAPGTGDGTAIRPTTFQPFVRPTISCTDFGLASLALNRRYPVQTAFKDSFAENEITPPSSSRLLDSKLLATALASYAKHNCPGGTGSGPQQMIVVDFAKKSSEPRLYRIDLKTGEGIDAPVLVAHGKGSDPNDDGYADLFSNVENSLMSSLGAVRGAEVYQGNSGRSLRLDGLEYSNDQMRRRYIVVHSYRGESRRYFNAGFQSQRGDTPGASEGCFVIPPEKRDWLIDTLAYGGFLYAGVSGERGEQIMAAMNRPPVTLQPGQQVVFVKGTGTGSTP